MAALLIELTAQEQERLRALEMATGKSQNELLHLALDQFFAQTPATVDPSEKPTENLSEGERPTWGIWGHERVLPEDFHEWRKAQDRLDRLYPEQR